MKDYKISLKAFEFNSKVWSLNNFITINFEPLIELNENDFIVVQLLQRRKDNEHLEHPVKRLKVYNFYSWKELKNHLYDIVTRCDYDNARAYIRLNKQNAEDISLKSIIAITKNIQKGLYQKNRNVWDSLVGQFGEERYWILDFDKEHLDFLQQNSSNEKVEQVLIDKLKTLNLRKTDKLKKGYILNQTRSAYHVIINPFDPNNLKEMQQEFKKNHISPVMILKDANTLLYYKK